MENATKLVIKSSDILAMLQQGKTRAEIIKELNLTTADAKLIFSSPSLKGKKTWKAPTVVFEDDLSEPQQNVAEENSNGVEVENISTQNEVEEEVMEANSVQQGAEENLESNDTQEEGENPNTETSNTWTTQG